MRSLKASPKGIKQANKAILNFASKADFASELEISRATVQKFFAAKPIARENFHKICQKLELPWQAIIDLDENTEATIQLTSTTYELDTLVQEVRLYGHASIQQSCSVMRVLDMSQPIELNQIYTSTKIIEKITGRRRLEIADILTNYGSDEFEQSQLSRNLEQPLLALEAVKQYSKLIILGKPGSGKTMFLKYLALQCSLGKFQANLVPIFITLKDYAETEQQSSLLTYISEQFATCGLTDSAAIKTILSQGRALILLEGLDQVREVDQERVYQEVRNFSAKFHNNYFVITCRIAALKYSFEQFAEVEVADFDQEQITTFATKWFVEKNTIKSNKFINKVQSNPSLLELASNPLLLTLLCLIFEESAEFPINEVELAQEAIDILLRKWDAKRNIERSPLYKLSVQQKQDLLSQIARITFDQGKYLFRKQELKYYIIDYICNLPGVSSDVEALQLNSEIILKSLESDHGLLVERAKGIYSFSYTTFQKYFIAKEIISISNPQDLEIALAKVARCIIQKQWHEVFLLTAYMLQNADYLIQLAKQEVDNLISQDNYLQKFLSWLDQKSRTVNVKYKLVAIRAFYLDISLGLDFILNSDLSLALKLDHNLSVDLEIALNLERELNFALSLTHELQCNLALSFGFSFDCELQRSLQHLKEQLPKIDKDKETFKAWWKAKGKDWIEQFKKAQINYSDISQNWQFDPQQKKVLQQYHNANNLLINCLKGNCYINHIVREKIEKSLFLPIKTTIDLKT